MTRIHVAEAGLPGLIEITADGWDGRILRGSRNLFHRFKDHRQFELTGIYAIYADHFDKQARGRNAYIGEGDKVGKRLKKHDDDDDKRFWNEFFIVTANWLRVGTHTKNFEAWLIDDARTAARYVVTNVPVTRPSLSAEERERLRAFYDKTVNVLRLANIQVLEPNRDHLFESFEGLQVRVSSYVPLHVYIAAGTRIPVRALDAGVIAAAGIAPRVEDDSWVFDIDAVCPVGADGSILGIGSRVLRNDQHQSLTQVISLVERSNAPRVQSNVRA